MVRLLMQNYYMELLESDNYRVRNLLLDIQGSPECEHHIKTIPDVSKRPFPLPCRRHGTEKRYFGRTENRL